MSVFTPVSEGQLADWLKGYSVGIANSVEPVAAGIENTNYFVTTGQGRYVLTLFERLSAGDLPVYLGLMAHLARHGIPCPAPVAYLSDRYLSELNGKPAALVTRLPGTSVEAPGAAECAERRLAPLPQQRALGRFHGPVTVRTALANSFNIPAVKTLDFVGIYDDPNTPQKEGMIGMAEKLGITTFTRPDYGLALTLGGGDVSLLQETGAYAVIANGGKKVPPVAILKIVDYQGNVVYEYQPPAGEQVIRPEHAFLMSSILSDHDARAPMSGRNSLLNLPFQVAAKTGTTNDFRDNWTLGYTPDLVTGVWAW